MVGVVVGSVGCVVGVVSGLVGAVVGFWVFGCTVAIGTIVGTAVSAGFTVAVGSLVGNDVGFTSGLAYGAVVGFEVVGVLPLELEPPDGLLV